MNQIKGLYAFQEITEEKELLAAFRMRYQTYQEQPDLCVLTPENAANVDIDAYDIYARHFGVFKINTKPKVLIGYVRLIEIRKNQKIESTIRKIENLFHLTPAYRSHSFYFQRNFLNAQHIIGFFSNKNLNHIVEPSRFIISKPYKSMGLSQFIINSLMTTIHSNPDYKYAVIQSQNKYVNFYERNGFKLKKEALASPLRPHSSKLLIMSRAELERKMIKILEKTEANKRDNIFYCQL